MSDSETTAGEDRVLADAPSGLLVDLSDLPDEQRVVSADLIRRLCVAEEPKDVDPRGIRIKGARIVDPLDLSYCTVAHPLRFEATTFAVVPDLVGADLPAVWFEHCSLPGVRADGLRTGSFSLDSSRVSGQVRLIGARIDGQLSCVGATLSNEGGLALSADQAEISGGVFLNDGFIATGAVRLLDARIGGLECANATLSNKGGDALAADRAEITGSVFLGGGFSATGAVRLQGARIGGELYRADATLANKGGDALDADGAEITGGVFLGRRFSATGAVRLLAARIGGQLRCADATLSNKGGDALSAEGAEITGGVFLRGGFRTTGAVGLFGARIGGQLDCADATLSNKGGDALFVEGAEITGSVFLRGGFRATGAVRLQGARIGGQLSCEGATLSNEGGDALEVENAEVVGHVLLRAGFSASGEVRLHGAKIGGSLDLSNSTLVNAAEAGYALDCRDARIGGRLRFRDVQVTGGVDLFRASATTLEDDLGREDDPLGSWGDVQPLILDGFTYERFAQESASNPRLRQRWLQHTDDFQQGAWQHLIQVYRSVGRDDEATSTSIAMHNDRVARAGLPWYRVMGRWILWALVGHGYRPWLAAVWAAGVITAFALVVWNWSGLFLPAQGVTGSPQPFAYAADSFLPIVDLGQADGWTPTGWLRWVEWVVILFGWSLSTIFVAGFTRIVRTA